MKRFLPLILCPLIGAGLAWIFRPRPLDPATFVPDDPPEGHRRTVTLPGGHSLRFLGIPDPAGGVAFYLSEQEISTEVWADFSSEPVTLENARRFTEFLSQQSGIPFRLPSAAEWRLAARGGRSNATVPWGYGKDSPPPGLAFRLETPPHRPGPALGYGFRDMAGGRWEWTREGLLLGGAWSEQNPVVLQIDHAWIPPQGYGDQDTGLRLLMEIY